MSLDVPELVRQRAIANGAAGHAWLAALPHVIDRLTSRWDLRLGRAYQGGTAGYVVAAVDSRDRPCVLKVAMPLDIDEVETFHRAVAVHELADGRACARLLEVDPDTPALLLEQLGPNLDDIGLQVPELLETIAVTLASFWRSIESAEQQHLFPTAADKAEWLASFITTQWEALGEPCNRLVIDRAVSYCHARAAAFDPSTAVLCHGDAHGWNTVRAGDRGYKFIDPEGVWAERALDLSVPMREYNEPLLAGETHRLARQRAEHLASMCGVDVEAVWQWGFIERVSTGLANVRDFDGPGGQLFLEVAERCL